MGEIISKINMQNKVTSAKKEKKKSESGNVRGCAILHLNIGRKKPHWDIWLHPTFNHFSKHNLQSHCLAFQQQHPKLVFLLPIPLLPHYNIFATYQANVIFLKLFLKTDNGFPFHLKPKPLTAVYKNLYNLVYLSDPLLSHPWPSPTALSPNSLTCQALKPLCTLLPYLLQGFHNSSATLFRLLTFCHHFKKEFPDNLI